jgi:hypothetical protein
MGMHAAAGTAWLASFISRHTVQDPIHQEEQDRESAVQVRKKDGSRELLKL